MGAGPGTAHIARALAGGIGLAPPVSGPGSLLPPAPGMTAALRDPLAMLVERTSMGFNVVEWQAARTLGFDAYLDYQLDWQNIDNSLIDTFEAGLPTLTMSPKELFDGYQQASNIPILELQVATLVRGFASARQLHERMVEFWTDHFNIDVRKNAGWLFMAKDQRDVIRPHALGRFPDMLAASAHSPGMMYYLDNFLSFAQSYNENYSREIMELHTLSSGGGYTLDDIIGLARCFTGWSLEFDDTLPTYGQFRYYPQLHDNGQKFVLGQTIQAGGGQQDVNTMLDVLAYHPSTAQFLATKLCKWLLTYDPPQSLVDAVATRYLVTGGDITQMVRLILTRDNLLAAHTWDERKLRRPYHFLTSMLRGTFAPISGINVLFELERMGQMPFQWPAPDGYPDKVSAWGGAVFSRWDLAVRMFNNQIPGVDMTDSHIALLVAGVPHGSIARHIDLLLTGGTLPKSQVSSIQTYVNTHPIALQTYRDALALTASSPGYQDY